MATTSKIVRVSDDNGATWHILPGNSADLSVEAGQIDDTIFGQDYKSSQAGIVSWTVKSNAIYKGFAGYNATVKITGSPVAVTNEATTDLTGGVYQITDVVRRILDPASPVVVKDGGIAVAASNIEYIDYLWGIVKFAPGYTVTGAVTIDASYLPVTDLCGANSYTLTQTAEATDTTDMCTAQSNGGYRKVERGIKTVSMELSGFYSNTTDYIAKLVARGLLVLELNAVGNDEAIARGFFRATSVSQSGSAGNPEEESLSFQLAVPAKEDMRAPFSWQLATTASIPEAIKIALNGWNDGSTVKVQYLPAGTTGYEGDSVVSEVSLSGGLEGMNEFSVTMEGTGALTNV